MKLVYDVNQRPPLKKNLVYAFQQLLAIMAATLLVPILADATGLYLNQPAALFGAGVGTLFYTLVATRAQEPRVPRQRLRLHQPAGWRGGLWLSAASFLGAVFAGLVYALIALIIKKTGSGWVNKLLPPGGHRPHRRADRFVPVRQRREQPEQHRRRQLQPGFTFCAGLLVAFFVTVWASVKGSKSMRDDSVHHRHSVRLRRRRWC